MRKTADMQSYQRDWYHKKRKADPDYAEKRRQYRLDNYERIREQEKKSREKNIEKHRADSRQRMHRYRQTERYKEVKPLQDLKRKYGLSKDQWDNLFASQGKACAICGTTENNGKKWHTDHCHTTGMVRGILCSHCNLMLGHARDSRKTLLNAVQYLSKTNLPTE